MRFIASFLLLSACASAQLVAGAAKNTITPDLKLHGPVYIAGFGNNRTATGVHDDLWARCVALKAGARPLVVCAVDLIGLFADDTRRIRDEIRQSVRDADVVIAATHVHEGPDTLGLWGPSQAETGINDAYMRWMTGTVAKTAVAALESLAPARVSFAVVHSAQLDSFIDDSRPPVRHDSDVIAMRLLTSGGTPLATVVNWANHPETLDSKNRLITSDYPHYLRLRLEQRLGGMALLLNGALGGMQSPLGSKLASPDGTFAKAELIGNRVAEMTADAIVGAPQETVDLIAFRETDVKIPMVNQGFLAAAKGGIFKGRKQPDAAGNTAVPVGLVRFGARERAVAEIALIPGEMYPELSVGGVERYSGADFADAPIEPAIKLAMSARYRMLVGLANDENGYIIPKCEWDTQAPFLNGAPRAYYGEVNSLGPEAAPRIAAAFLDLLKK